jgi:hypothetical protein
MSLTITIDSPPAELVALAATPEGMAQVRAMVLDAFGMGDDEPDEETLGRMRRGLADIEAGRTYSFEEAYRDGRADLVTRMSKKEAGLSSLA